MSALTRRLAALAGVLAVLAGGTALGLASAYLVLGGEAPLGAVRSGPWTAWPTAGSPDADPYARAIDMRSGRIALAAGAGLRFIATTDSEGHALAGHCDYAVGGPTPPAQAWTLTLLDPGGMLPPEQAGRAGFTSAEVVRDVEGGFVVTVAAQTRPGNWLPAGRIDGFALMLSVYDTPLARALRMGGAVPPLPSIVKGSCA